MAQRGQQQQRRIEADVRRAEVLPEGAHAIHAGLDRTSAPMAEPAVPPVKPPRRRHDKPYVRKVPDPIRVRIFLDDVKPVRFSGDGDRSTMKRGPSGGRYAVARPISTNARKPRGLSSLDPLDAELNLPAERYSHGVRRRVAQEATRGSFDDAVEAVATTTGAHLPKRQAEALVVAAAADFESFYREREVATRREVRATSGVLVLTTDAQGVVMRKSSLRPATQRAAAKQPKLKRRLAHQRGLGARGGRPRVRGHSRRWSRPGRTREGAYVDQGAGGTADEPRACHVRADVGTEASAGAYAGS